jgi:cytochrome P450
VLAPSLFVPPRPEPPADAPPGREFLRLVRTNALRMWPVQAYEQDAFQQGFFGLKWTLLNDPAAIHHVLVENAANYRRTAATIRVLRPIVGNGLLLSEGEAWKHQRRTIAPALAPRVLPVLARHIAAASRDAATALAAQADQPLPLVLAMQQLALDIAGRSMFSLATRDFGQEMRELITWFGMTLAGPRLLDMVLPIWMPSPRDFRRRRFQARWMAFIDRIIGARLAEPAAVQPRDLFDLLRTARDPETGIAFTPTQLRDQVATMIVAGHETTATTLFWSLYLLAADPAEQAHVADEVRGMDLGPDAAWEAIGQLPRTRAVVNEALRLYPPAFTIVRQAMRADRAHATEIPRGGVVMVSPWVLHRHRQLWRDPDAFDPTRFLPDAPQPPRFAYLPFGAGPRICVGAQFALTEAAIVLATLMQAFKIDLDDHEPVLPVGVVTLQPNRLTTFRLRPRADRAARRAAGEFAEDPHPTAA